MWLNYEERYQQVVCDPYFLVWRRKGARHKARNILAVCGSRSIDSVIEIGCGTGAVLGELMDLKFARTYFGTDVSPSALQMARRELGNEYRGGFVAESGTLPLESTRFSIAILSHVLEHLREPSRAAREAARVAEFVAVEVPTERVFTNWIRRNLFRRPYRSIEDAGHIQFWSHRSFVRFLSEECAFTILAIKLTLVSSEEDFYGKRGISKLKPSLKHAIQAFLPIFLLTRLFTTHTTVLCRPALRREEFPPNPIDSHRANKLPVTHEVRP